MTKKSKKIDILILTLILLFKNRKIVSPIIALIPFDLSPVIRIHPIKINKKRNK